MTLDTDLARLTVRLSRIAYRGEDRARGDTAALGLGEFRFFSSPPNEALSVADGGTLYLAFRGTEKKVIDWVQNARFNPVRGELGGLVHAGFHSGLDDLWEDLLAVVDAAGRPVVTTGHSLGGALATLAAARLHEGGREVAAVYTYGQPRVGLSDFSGAYRSRLGDVSFRFINHIDLVTRVPLLIQRYRHIGKRVYFDESGDPHVGASAWHIARDDLVFRLRHFGRLKAAGLAPHERKAYVDLVERM